MRGGLRVVQDSVETFERHIQPPGRKLPPTLTFMLICSVVLEPCPASAAVPVTVTFVDIAVLAAEDAEDGVVLDGMALADSGEGDDDIGANPNARRTNCPLRFIVIFPVDRMPASVPKLFLNKSGRPSSSKSMRT